MHLTIQETLESAVSHGPTELRHVDYLDGWRGLAIALVLEEHFVGFLPMASGRFGVDVFFSLSGLLMGNILFVRRVPLATFYKRRISRVVPVFVLFVLTIYSFSWLRGTPGSWAEFFATLTFLRTYLPLHPSIWPHGGRTAWESAVPIQHLWSLNVEEHCYIFLSLVTLPAVLRGREWIALLLASVTSFVVFVGYICFPVLSPHWRGLGTETVAAHVLLSAAYSLQSYRFAGRVRGWMPLLGIGLATVCYSDRVADRIATICCPFLLAFAVNHLPQSPTLFRAMLAFPALRLLGVWSFSIYLWQQPFFIYKHHLPGGTTLGLLLSILVGIASFYLIENPIRTWLNKRW